eukprot:scaffold10867_cov95-Skeletonema_marinoi.AAC.1
MLESKLADVSDASSGDLRRCNDADTTPQCLRRAKDASILSWPTIMGHWKLWIVCNLASGHYTSFPTNELTSSRAVFVQPLGACYDCDPTSDASSDTTEEATSSLSKSALIG